MCECWPARRAHRRSAPGVRCLPPRFVNDRRSPHSSVVRRHRHLRGVSVAKAPGPKFGAFVSARARWLTAHNPRRLAWRTRQQKEVNHCDEQYSVGHHQAQEAVVDRRADVRPADQNIRWRRVSVAVIRPAAPRYDAIQKGERARFNEHRTGPPAKGRPAAPTAGTISCTRATLTGVVGADQCLTDNRNRAASEVRVAMTRNVPWPIGLSYLFSTKAW